MNALESNEQYDFNLASDIVKNAGTVAQCKRAGLQIDIAKKEGLISNAQHAKLNRTLIEKHMDIVTLMKMTKEPTRAPQKRRAG